MCRNWVAYEWEGERMAGEEESKKTRNQLLWVIVKGAEYDIAVGIVT